MQRYDFPKFLERMAALDFLEILSEAEREANRVDDSTRKVPVCGAKQGRRGQRICREDWRFLILHENGPKAAWREGRGLSELSLSGRCPGEERAVQRGIVTLV